MKVQLRPLFMAFVVALLCVMTAQAQTATDAQALTTSLSMLPEAEVIVYVNASRIVTDVAPRVLPPKELQEMRNMLEQVKAFTRIDLKDIEFMVIATRFSKPTGASMFPLPEAMFVTRGDFEVQPLLGMAMMMSEGKLREEQYGSHKINVIKLDEFAKDAAKNPFAAAFSEIAIAALDANTLAVGNTSYIKAALDAADGRGRIKAETVASILRDPTALISISGSPMMAFAKSFGLRMAENRDGQNNCMTQFGEFYASINMDAQNFKLTGAMNADNPDTARLMRNMLSGFFEQTKSSVPDKNAQTIFDEVKLIAEGSEVLVQANIPIDMAVKYVREMFAPPPKPIAVTTTEVKTQTPAKPKSTKPKRKK
ncbi:MAG: hypothetical protein H7Y30_03130 [Pyrinomonadaceae bacterium]|nr:hypothetical protein [Pyrinomonadaceae bacterium]